MTGFVDYSRSGKPNLIVSAIARLLNDAVLYAVPVLPAAAASFFARYFNSLGSLLQDTGDTWAEYRSGNSKLAAATFQKSVEQAYFAMLTAALSAQVAAKSPQKLALLAEAQLPDLSGILHSVATSTGQGGPGTPMSQVLGIIDPIVGNLTGAVMSYRQHIDQGQVCWKQTSDRERQLPSTCPPGYTWDGGWVCQDSGQSSGLDGTARGKRPPVTSQCDTTSVYSQRQNGWCFKNCPLGTEVVGAGSCRTKCGSIFPADDGAGLCGVDPGAIAAATQQMIASTFTSALTIGLDATNFNSDSPSTIANSLINTGKSFAYQMCPGNLAAAWTPVSYPTAVEVQTTNSPPTTTTTVTVTETSKTQATTKPETSVPVHTTRRRRQRSTVTTSTETTETETTTTTAKTTRPATTTKSKPTTSHVVPLAPSTTSLPSIVAEAAGCDFDGDEPDTKYFWDPRCRRQGGAIGCLADGFHLECRFCGSGIYAMIPCPREVLVSA